MNYYVKKDTTNFIKYLLCFIITSIIFSPLIFKQTVKASFVCEIKDDYCVITTENILSQEKRESLKFSEIRRAVINKYTKKSCFEFFDIKTDICLTKNVADINLILNNDRVMENIWNLDDDKSIYGNEAEQINNLITQKDDTYNLTHAIGFGFNGYQTIICIIVANFIAALLLSLILGLSPEI